MGILSRKGVSVVDYTLLQKKGLIKKQKETKKEYTVNSQGFVDLTTGSKGMQGQDSTLSNAAVQASQNDSTQSPFSFFDNIAQTSTSTDPCMLSTQANTEISDSEINAVKIKIDDLEFKLSNLVDKLTTIETKLADFEKRVFN